MKMKKLSYLTLFILFVWLVALVIMPGKLRLDQLLSR